MMTLRQTTRDKAQPPDKAHADDIVIEPEGAHEGELHEFVRRCRELLARHGPKDFPPGHWLG